MYDLLKPIGNLTYLESDDDTPPIDAPRLLKILKQVVPFFKPKKERPLSPLENWLHERPRKTLEDATTLSSLFQDLYQRGELTKPTTTIFLEMVGLGINPWTSHQAYMLAHYSINEAEAQLKASKMKKNDRDIDRCLLIKERISLAALRYLREDS